jgi:hypothetical protein
MLTTPANPREPGFFRNSRKFIREAQSTVSRFGKNPGSGPVTHCGAATAEMDGRKVPTAAKDAPMKARRLK